MKTLLIEGDINMDEIKVSISCTVYNHEKFLVKTLEGFLKQKTNFAFEVLIHDDASTDGSVKIIKEYAEKYPNIIKPYYQKENQYSKKNGIIGKIQIERALGKYIAICEGDDYWIDPNKLQIQVDYLDAHDECTFCCHSGIFVDESGNRLPGLFREFSENCIVPTNQVIRRWLCPTASIVYRKATKQTSDFPPLVTAPCGDYPLAVNMALHGTVYYIDRPMCAYRKNSGSVSAAWDRKKEVRHSVNSHFIEMIDEIDTYSHYQYHDDFLVMRNARELINLLIERKYVEALKPKYNVVRKLKAKDCIYFVLSDRAPWLLHIYERIRDRHRKK